MEMEHPLKIFLYAHQNVNSLKSGILAFSRQTFKKWHLTIIEDASSDDSLKEIQRLSNLYGLSDRIEIINQTEKKGFLGSVYPLIKNLQNLDQYVFLMNADFRLAHEKALEKIVYAHQNGWEMVYGKWKNREQVVVQNIALHPFEAIRSQPWCFCAPFSFKRKYFESIQERELKDESGDFLNAIPYQALAFPIFEQSIKRRFLNESLWINDQTIIDPFDDLLVWQDHLLTSEQKMALKTLDQISPKLLKVDQVFFQENLYEFMENAFLGERSLSRYELSHTVPSSMAKAPINRQKSTNTPSITKMPNPFTQDKSNPTEKPSALAQALMPQPTPTPEEQAQQEYIFELEDLEWFASQKDFQTALSIGKKLLLKNPDDARLHTNMGVIYWTLEESKLGMNHFVQAMRCDKNSRDPVLNCAAAWVELGQIEQAKKLCRNFLNDNPKDQPILELLTELEQKYS
jgi:tetratricopeptide (TPR) repeat protein